MKKESHDPNNTPIHDRTRADTIEQVEQILMDPQNFLEDFCSGRPSHYDFWNNQERNAPPFQEDPDRRPQDKLWSKQQEHSTRSFEMLNENRTKKEVGVNFYQESARTFHPFQPQAAQNSKPIERSAKFREGFTKKSHEAALPLFEFEENSRKREQHNEAEKPVENCYLDEWYALMSPVPSQTVRDSQGMPLNSTNPFAAVEKRNNFSIFKPRRVDPRMNPEGNRHLEYTDHMPHMIKQGMLPGELHNNSPHSFRGFNRQDINCLYREPVDYRKASMPYGMRKRRKNSYSSWSAACQGYGTFPPSRYSSLEFIQGTSLKVPYSPPMEKPIEKNQNNHMLSSILENSTAPSKEQTLILLSYSDAVKRLDLENITVFQLKALMKEYGLNHAGKKGELIEFIRATHAKIESMNLKKAVEVKNDVETKEEGTRYDGFYF